jgi:hypothetical protein
MKTFIYILMDPITDEIRYIGKSINPTQRYRKHIYETKTKNLNNHKINWIKSLLNKNLKPKMDIIDSIEGDWVWLEEYWISQFLTWGFNLVNSTNGGENPPSWKGRTHSDEYKEIRRNLMLTNNPSKHMTNEWKQNISLAHKKNGFIPNKASESNKIKVNQYSLNNEFIKTWNSITEAAKAVGLKRPTGISAVCNNKRNKAGGFKWSYN